MQPISDMSLAELVRRREEVSRKLREREPLLMQEIDLYDAAIRSYDHRGDKPYAAVKWPKTAIPMCLARNRAWMTREQIQRDLEAGGFVFDPIAFPQLLSDALRYHSRNGTWPAGPRLARSSATAATSRIPALPMSSSACQNG